MDKVRWFLGLSPPPVGGPVFHFAALSYQPAVASALHGLHSRLLLLGLTVCVPPEAINKYPQEGRLSQKR